MGKRPLLLLFFAILAISIFIQPRKTNVEKMCSDMEKGKLKGVVSFIREKENSLEITVENGIVKNIDKQKICSFSKILVYLKENNTSLRIGNQVYITGSILPFKKPTNLGQFNEYDYYKAKKYECKMYGDSLRIEKNTYNKPKEQLRQWKKKWQTVFESQLPSSQAGIIEAMVLGEKDNLDEKVKELYQKNGIGHIMAISGLHISILGLGIYQLLKRIGFCEWFSISISILFLLFYGMLTDFSVSASRAIIMIILALLAKLVGRTYDMLTAMAVSGIIILLNCPMQIRSCSFLLSFGAVFGIGFICPILKDSIRTKSKIINGLLAGISVQLVILPITAYFFYQIPIYGIIINLFILPFMSFLLIISILAVISFYISPILGKFIFGSVHGILWYYEKICLLFEKLPNSNFVIGKPSVFQIIIYIILISSVLFFLYHYKFLNKYLIYCLPCFMLILCHIPSKQLEMTMLDVGQGDSIFFRTGKTTYLMDGGSTDIKKIGTYRILPFLKASGVGTLDYMIISHTDKDHINGLIEILEEVREGQYHVKNLLLPQLITSDKPYKRIEHLARQCNIPIFYLEKGTCWKKEKLYVTCLHPNKDFLEEDKNECSTILSVKYGMVQILLTGDVEQMGEQEILPLLGEHQILKVAHHGSKTSSTEAFLEKVKPKVALISCGKNNSYGHPHEEVLERMEEMNSKIYNTCINGSICIKSDGMKVKVKRYIES